MPAGSRDRLAEEAEQQAILEAGLAGLVPPPGDELQDFMPDPECDAPLWWRAEPPEGIAAAPAGSPAQAEPHVAGARVEAATAADAGSAAAEGAFTADGAAEAWPGAGFADGEVLDQLVPGPALAGLAEDVLAAGLPGLDDDQLVGVLAAVRRLGSWTTAMEADAVTELTRRRGASGHSRDLDFLAEEIAIALRMSSQAGDGLVSFCAGLAQLPATLAALRAGRIDRLRAMAIVEELSWLDQARALAVEQLLIGPAADMTSGQLRARARQAVQAADPEAAERRRRERQRDARVQLWCEPSGTAGLAGRDLPTAAALAADARIDTQARALKAAGASATLTQLRAAVFLALLAGQDVNIMLAAILGAPPADATPDQDASAVTAPPGSPDTPSPQPRSDRDPTASPDRPATPTGPAAGSGSAPPPGPADGPGSAPPPGPAASPGSAPPPGPAAGPGASGVDAPAGSGAAAAGDGLVLRGSVHLTVPLNTWLGFSASPGEIAGFGPADAGTCRELADRIAASGGSRWCLSITDAAGHAIAHACASRPPPAGPGEASGWLGRLKVFRIESENCSHARESPGYRVPDSLHHIVKTRQRTCAAPGCRRRASRCDDDHTLAYDRGGRSCECNLAPLCRRHHRAKQSEGWHLEQPEPGILVWTLPHRRRYTVGPGIYPA
ncbi:MAG TPA: HNH endonuclease signature motif containing protein [Streptosporangiaceae bacterium]|jgi:hypothetical protein